MGRPRPMGYRVMCGSNMKQIGSAILLYSRENQKRYPLGLKELVLTQDIQAGVFVCPSSDAEPATGPTTRVVADALGGEHLSYVYLGAGLTTDCDPDTVVLYELPENHAGDGMNVLFGDGHVEFVDKVQAGVILDRVATARGRPVVWNASNNAAPAKMASVKP
jgi:prepilin-type processing-associated H-X9-DG protein